MWFHWGLGVGHFHAHRLTSTSPWNLNQPMDADIPDNFSANLEDPAGAIESNTTSFDNNTCDERSIQRWLWISMTWRVGRMWKAILWRQVVAMVMMNKKMILNRCMNDNLTCFPWAVGVQTQHWYSGQNSCHAIQCSYVTFLYFEFNSIWSDWTLCNLDAANTCPQGRQDIIGVMGIPAKSGCFLCNGEISHCQFRNSRTPGTALLDEGWRRKSQSRYLWLSVHKCKSESCLPDLALETTPSNSNFNHHVKHAQSWDKRQQFLWCKGRWYVG